MEQFREHKAHVEAEAKAAAMEDSQKRLERLELQGKGEISSGFCLPCMLVIRTDQIGVIKEVQAVQEASGQQQQSAEFRSILLWLGGGVDNKAVFQRNLTSRHTSTGDWFLEHPAVTNWINAESSGSDANVLWCYGPGKTQASHDQIE